MLKKLNFKSLKTSKNIIKPKIRGCYETPAGTLLVTAHRGNLDTN